MTYQVLYSKESRKTLKSLPKNIALNILTKIEALTFDPYAQNNNVKSLNGISGFRLRVGDYRVLYQLDNNILHIHVLTIAPRGDVYK